MCAIFGIWNKKGKIDSFGLKKSQDLLKHRGPDDEGIFFEKNFNLALAHQRLAILDLTKSGHQPMVFKNLVIVYNGEVYNFKEIRRKLQKKGYKFESNSDTEVVLKNYFEWQKKSVLDFRGMFAFAIWDRAKKKLIFCRDRLGVKPLYYYLDNNLFIFASELKAILSYKEIKKEINFEALRYFLEFGYIPAPLTIFKNIYKLEPAHFLEIDKNFKIKKEKYWKIEDCFLKEKLDLEEEETLETVENLLKESFFLRTVADVEVGVFLSGGIDSSLLSAILQKNSSKKIKTFTIGFFEKEYDEAPFAKKVAQILGTDHFEYYVSSNDLKGLLEKFVKIYDEPFGDSASLPMYLLSNFASKKVKVLLSADGGDELFLGYTKYEILNLLQKLPLPLRFFLKKILKNFSPKKAKNLYQILIKFFGFKEFSHFKERWLKFINLMDKNQSELIYFSGNYWQEKEIDSLLKEPVSGSSFLEKEFLKIKNLKLPFLEKIQLWDLKTYLSDDLLTKTDRSTMFASIEAREPYLDHKLIEFLTRIPLKLKFKNNELKYLSKKLLLKYLPKELVSRPKAGFCLPLEKWLKNDWKELLKENLDFFYLKKQGLFNPDYLQKILNDFFQKEKILSEKIWLLLVFQLWYQRWGK